jgi:anti-sigma factor RsiW
MDDRGCSQLVPLVTPYVDGELPPDARARVDAHIRVCAPCYSRIAAERGVRELIQAHRAGLSAECASSVLRERCAGLLAGRGAPRRGSLLAGAFWRERFVPFALAATLVLIVGGAFLYQLTDGSARVMAAELTADHVKCFAMNDVLGTREQPMTVQASMSSHFGWMLQLPQNPQRVGLELVGARPCLYGEGRVAHLMFRHHGVPVSVFMLPSSVRPQEIIEVMGHEAAVWSSGQRTFVLIAREPRQDVEQLASFVQASLR